jgi:hypothetical protein
MRQPHRPAIIAIALVLAAVTTVSAQVGGAPGPPSTLWSFLGIPQGIQKVKGAMLNRRGKHPGLEPKPPLKAIADPANLESKDAAIKKAAELKTAEDMKKQKIKAVKYLASIGCGCYDIDGGVTEAMVAAMGDCTEDVRLETVKAIADAAGDGCCSKCGSVCCCNKDILMKLAEMAYERDDHGCYVEPSERVRQEAAKAIEICCPNNLAPVIIDELPPEPIPEPETIPEPVRPELPSDDEEDLREISGNSFQESEELPDNSKQFRNALNLLYPEPNLPHSRDKTYLAHQVEGNSARNQVQVVSSRQSKHSNRSLLSTVVHVNPKQGLVHVHFATKSTQVPVGSRISIYRNLKGKRTYMGELEVVESFAGSANISGSTECLAAFSRGDVIRWSFRTAGLQRIENSTNSMFLR